jgi:hypothetical protein
VLLVDTSAWIDHLRGSDTAVARQLRQLLRDRVSDLATTEPVVMELLAGARDEAALRSLETLTNGLVQLPVNAHRDYHDAAALHRAGRRRGRTVRKLVDCLIAAVALRNQATLVHNDADFDTIAEIAPLRTHRLGGD